MGSDSFFHFEDTGLAEAATVRPTRAVNLHHGDTVWLTPDGNRIPKFGTTGDRIG